MEPTPKLWLPHSPQPPKPRIDTGTLLAVVSIVASVVFGVLGIAHMIPSWLLIPALVVCAVVLAFSLWRSDWLLRKPRPVRILVVVAASIIYCGITGSALWHVLRTPVLSTAPPPAPPGPRTDGPCSPIITGNGNTTTANCEDAQKKPAPKSAK